MDYTIHAYGEPSDRPTFQEIDFKDINAINHLAFTNPPQEPMTEDEFKQFLNQDRLHFFVARDVGGRIVSTLTLYILLLSCGGKSQRKAYIEQVATHPDHEKRGLASRLLEEAELVITEGGVHTARLTTSKDAALAFYRNRPHWNEIKTTVFEFDPA